MRISLHVTALILTASIATAVPAPMPRVPETAPAITAKCVQGAWLYRFGDIDGWLYLWPDGLITESWRGETWHGTWKLELVTDSCDGKMKHTLNLQDTNGEINCEWFTFPVWERVGKGWELRGMPHHFTRPVIKRPEL